MVFLVAILFSFSTSAYNSLKQFSKTFDLSIKKVHYNASPDNNVISNSIIFEELENENDNEDFSTEAFLVLPFSSLAFDSFESKTPYHFSKPLQKATEPIFISIRSIRI